MIDIKVQQLTQLLSGLLGCAVTHTRNDDGYLVFGTNLWVDEHGGVREEHELEEHAEYLLTDTAKELLFRYLCLWSGGDKCSVRGEYSRGILEVILGTIGTDLDISLTDVKELCYDKCIAVAEEVCDGRGEDAALEDLVTEIEFILAHGPKATENT